jgi:hypothetical protein
MAALIEVYRFLRCVAANGFEGAFEALTIQATGFAGRI